MTAASHETQKNASDGSQAELLTHRSTAAVNREARWTASHRPYGTMSSADRRPADPGVCEVGDRSLHLWVGHTSVRPVAHQHTSDPARSPLVRAVAIGWGHRPARSSARRSGRTTMSDATPDATPEPTPGTADEAGAPDFDTMTRDIADVPAVEVITTVAVHLMSAAAVNLGLAEQGEAHKDLDEARKLIHALA
ncbi:hypothetical protein GCM10020000_65240 [Streptomyces olivoverticillatus]